MIHENQFLDQKNYGTQCFVKNIVLETYENQFINKIKITEQHITNKIRFFWV